MTETWPMKPLVRIADIRVSNVDKKTSPVEVPVRLCNYMDVYSNTYVTGQLDFMQGSASPSEIERFTLRRGDVVITKDSETPDDIGIPAVVLDDIDGLVCGYHLALIRPNPEELDSVYLAKQLATARVARFFAQRATGSTRYGLPTSAIESVTIPTPPKPEQRRVAEVLSTVDRAIQQTERLIGKRQRTQNGLLQDLLTRGVDDDGEVRSERTHRFKDSPLGRIPEEWTVTTFGWGVESSAFGPRFPATAYSDSGGIATLRTTDLDAYGNIAYEKMPRASLDSRVFERHFLEKGDLLISRSGTIGIPSVFSGYDVPVIPGAFLIRFRLKKSLSLSTYWRAYFNSHGGRHRIVSEAEGGVQKNLRGSAVLAMLVAFPSFEEQQRIVATLDAADSEINAINGQRQKLHVLRTGLMQDLLSGRKRVTPLLEAAGRDLEQVS